MVSKSQAGFTGTRDPFCVFERDATGFEEHLHLPLQSESQYLSVTSHPTTWKRRKFCVIFSPCTRACPARQYLQDTPFLQFKQIFPFSKTKDTSLPKKNGKNKTPERLPDIFWLFPCQLPRPPQTTLPEMTEEKAKILFVFVLLLDYHLLDCYLCSKHCRWSPERSLR